MSAPLASTSLRPERALLHTAWIASLALLVANDHLLKGSGILPALVTGKLSDFAGMLVAPALLATLARARTRRGLLAVHIAVGIVFSLLEISPSAARATEWAMASIGVSWRLWPDLTDLVALPMLFVSWYGVVPSMTAARSLKGRLVDLARCAAATAGILACVATSAPPPPPVAPNGKVAVAGGASALPSNLTGSWRSLATARLLVIAPDQRYTVTDADGNETGRLEVLQATGPVVKVRFTDRQLDGRGVPMFESTMTGSADAITIDGEQFERR